MASNKEDKAPHPAAAATEDVPAATAQVTRPQPPTEETGCECKPAVIMHRELLLAARHGDLQRLHELLNSGDGPAAPTAAATQVLVEVDWSASSPAATSLLEGATFQGDSALHVAVTSGDDDNFLQTAQVARHEDLQRLHELLNSGDGPAAPTAAATQVVVEVDWSASSPAATSLLEGATFQGDSALHVAATSGDDDNFLQTASLIYNMAKHLLKAQNNNGDTPLHCASRAGRVKMVSHLIKLVGDDDGHEQVKKLLEKQNNRHETALHEAVRLADEDLIRELMKADHELARVPKDGTSPLYLAILSGHVKVARSLYENDPGLSYSGPNGQNALHAAVLRSEETTRMLLEWNKGLAEKGDEHGWTPLHLAASLETRKKRIVQLLLDDYYVGFRYFVGKSDILTALIENINVRTALSDFKNGLTAMLMDANKSLAYQPDNKGVFPIHIAASTGRRHVLNILLKKSPDCANLRNARGRTFLHVAVEENRYNIIRFALRRSLLASGIMNMQDNDGNTALHLAVQAGNMRAFRLLLLNRKVEINYLNNEGLTPLDISLRRIPKGLQHGSDQRIWILKSLRLANAQPGYSYQDHSKEKCICKMVGEKEEDSQSKNDDKKGGEQEDSKTLTEATQVVGICSALIATATFAAAFTLPGGYNADGQPTLAGTYSFDAFIVALTLAFICALIATLSLTYSGIAKVDYAIRLRYLNLSQDLVWSSIRSFVAAFAIGLYMVLAPVAHKTAVLVCVICFAALLYDHINLDRMLLNSAILQRRVGSWVWLTSWLEISFYILRPFRSYVIIFGWPAFLKVWRQQR